MNISKAAALSGLTAKTIRYYESSGLIAPASRSAAGYRDYSEADIHILKFIHRARDLGFSVKDCKALLSLYHDRQRASADVKAIAEDHINEISHKIDALQAMKGTLQTLVQKCHGDDRPDCPILEDLSLK